MLAQFTPENKLNELNKKIAETKKKIQLSEGQRKANFEEFEAKKHENVQQIGTLKQKVKDLLAKYTTTKNNDEEVANIMSISREASASSKRYSLKEAVSKMEEDNVRLRKKLDLVKYQFEQKQRKLNSLTQEYGELCGGNIQEFLKTTTKNPIKNKIIRLEVRLEHMRLMQMKANIMRMKYRSMRSDLKQKSVYYASSLKDLESDIKEQASEMKRLQGVKEEAIELRDNMQETLVKEEVEISNSSKDRDIVLQDYRRRVLERKMELERLERMIFQSRPRDDFDTRGKSHVQATEDITKDEVTRLEETFAKLRNATGVSRSEDVLNRFLGQRATKNNLQKMRTATEQEKMELEKQRQDLIAEMEMRKFSETKDAELNAEIEGKLNKEIDEQRERQQKAEQRCQRVHILLNKTSETLWHLCDKLRDIGDLPCRDEHESKNPLELIQVLNETIENVVQSFDSQDKFFEFVDEVLTDKVETVSIATGSMEGKATRINEVSLFPRFPVSPIPVTIPSEEEEDIPNRNVLKKQAQQLVDAKSRRKGFSFKR